MLFPDVKNWKGLRRIAEPYLSRGNIILEFASGDNTGPFYSLYPLVHPNGSYIVADAIHAEDFNDFVKEDLNRAIALGLVDKSFSPQKANLKCLSTPAQSKDIPGFDLALGHDVIDYLDESTGDIMHILENLRLKKNPNGRFLLVEKIYSDPSSSDLDQVEFRNKTVREICHQFLSEIEEDITQGYDYIIGKL
jgi:hypothetical protein